MSDQTATLNLILQLKAKTDELTEAQKKIAAFKDSLASLNQGIGAIGSGFASGLGLGGALTAVGAIKTIISESVGAMKDLVKEGVNLNAQMETAQFSIAGALRQFEPERFKSFSSALNGSADVVDALKQKSLDLGLSFPDLAHTYQATVGSMFKSGIYDIQKQVDLTALLSRTLASTGITGARAARDIADLFNGQANRIVALKALGISNEEIEGAKKKGELFEYIQGKLAGYKEAVDAAGQTTERLEQVLANTKSQVAAEGTKELTDSYKELLISLTALVGSDAFKSIFKTMVDGAKEATDALRALSQAFTINNVNKSVSEGANDVVKDASTSASSADVAHARSRAVVNRRANQNSLNDFTASAAPRLLESPYGQEKIKTYTDAIKAMDVLIQALDSHSATLIEKNQKLALEGAQQVAAAKNRQAEEEAGAFLEKNATKVDALNDKLSLVGLKDEERLKTLQQIANIKGEDYDAKAATVPAGSKQAEVIAFQRRKDLLPILNQIAATEAKISAEKERQDNLTEATGARLHKLAEQDAARDAVAAAKSKLDDIDAEKAGIVNDRYQTRLEKQAAVYALLKREPAAIDEIIKRLQTLSANTSDESAKHSIDNEVANLQSRKKGIPAQSKAVAPQSLGQDIQSNLVGLQSDFTTTGQAIAQTMQGAVNSLSSALLSLFDRSKTMGQRVSGIFLGIGQSAVKAAADMASQWLVKHTLMAGISKIFYTQDAAGHGLAEATKTSATVVGETTRTTVTAGHSFTRRAVALGETIFHGIQVTIRTAAHIAGEILKTGTSIVQGGIRIGIIIAESLASVIQGAVQAFSALSSIPYVGPFLGAAAMAAALVAGVALVGGIKRNFADGGMPQKAGYYAGAGGPRSDSNPVNISNGEYILNAQATSQIGKARLDEVNYTGRLPSTRVGSVSSGGGSGGGSRSGSPSVTNVHVTPNVVLVGSQQEAQRIADNTANETYFVKMARKHGIL